MVNYALNIFLEYLRLKANRLNFINQRLVELNAKVELNGKGRKQLDRDKSKHKLKTTIN
jgi:hypothetical protein